MIPIKTLVNTSFQLQNLTPSYDVNIARSFSRVNSVFLLMHGAVSATVRDVNTFIGADTEEINGRLQIGSQHWPTGQPIQGMSQFWYRLTSAVGVVHSASHNLAITRDEYENTKYIVTYDTDRCPTATGAGLNNAKGELITLSMKGLSNTHQRASVFAHRDCIIELRDTGADVLV